MSELLTVFVGIWLLFLAVMIGYWGNLAWFQPDTLKQRLIQTAERRPGNLESNTKFVERQGIFVMRIITFIGTLSILTLGIFIVFSLLGGMR